MKKKIIALTICTILFIYFSGGLIYNFLRKDNVSNEGPKIGNTIKGFDYLSFENDSEIYKNEFINLKMILEKEKIDYKEYAISINKLFLIDLYTLDNKINKYDIGGTDFVYPEVVDNYKLKVENTLYKYIMDNSDNDRKQELPIVKDIVIINVEETTYLMGEEEYTGYKIKSNIDYEKDLGYETESEVTIIKKDNKLYVVEKN